MFEKNLFEGKRILVTGGGTGLGKAMVRRMAQLGAQMIICGRRLEVLQETAQEIQKEFGRPVETFALDVRDPEAVEKTLDAIFSKGPLTGLINNAAGNFVSKTEDLSHRAVDAVLNIVLHGTSYVTLGCGKRWLASKTKANVLNIVTTYAWTGSAYVVPSAMAKAGVLAMTRSLAVEWGDRGIRMNAIAPGPFPTPGAWDRLVPNAEIAKQIETKNPTGRPGEHHELADLATFLMSDQASFINGEVVTIDGGEWLQGAGEFNFLKQLKDSDWQEMRSRAAKARG